MENPYILLMIFILIIPAVVILVPRWLRSKERQRILDAVVQAAEKGVTLPDSVMQSLIRAAAGSSLPTPPDPARDVRRGTFLMMIGVSIFVLGAAVLIMFFRTEGGPVGVLIAALGAVPFFIGMGYIGVGRMAERAARKNLIG